ncbi:MAG: uracil-DNA glycosylase, partial [Hyphomonadaceae bacterium]|nr:uracil-DNA glycosylase [Hyphomonadaceae bacterium]
MTTTMHEAAFAPEPARDCLRCPRLAAYRAENAALEPAWYNGPAPSFGDPEARLLIVGLAPG